MLEEFSNHQAGPILRLCKKCHSELEPGEAYQLVSGGWAHYYPHDCERNLRSDQEFLGERGIAGEDER